MSRTRIFAALAAAVIASACGAAPGASPTPAATPASTTAAAGPRVEMPSGAVYRLELALTPEEQAQGLMYRESLPERTGMLFIFNEDAPHQFWMKNTMIPLDMIWLDAAGKVLFVSAATPPCKADPCGTYGPEAPARQVLEIAGGLAAKERITVGSQLKILDAAK
ncbi:MAG: DUF192 domain-containing protein [Acidobacteriota bacterium]